MRKKLSVVLVIIAAIVAVYFILFPVKVANPAAPEPLPSNPAESSAG